MLVSRRHGDGRYGGEDNVSMDWRQINYVCCVIDRQCGAH